MHMLSSRAPSHASNASHRGKGNLADGGLGAEQWRASPRECKPVVTDRLLVVALGQVLALA